MKLNIKIFNYTVKAELKIDARVPRFYINIELPPMEMLGGLIVVYKSNDDSKNGPKFKADITPTGSDVDIHGRFKVV